MDTQTVEDKNGKDKGSRLRWWILLTVIVGTFLGRLDQTIVNLALPKIINDFNLTTSSAGWISTAYILANAVFVPIWGKLGDTIGRKKVYVAGFSIFILGSILAGLAWDLNSMILFRIIQAIAGSADYPTAMAILAVTFKAGKERAQALGIWSSSFAAASVFGPLLGGPLIDNFGWRSVFLINLPIGLIGLVMAMLFIEESKSERPTINFDFWGAITLGGMLSSIVLVLEKGTDWGWTSPEAIACYATALMFGYLFYRIDKDHPEPIVDFKFFKNNVFVGTLVNNVFIFMAMMGGIYIIPIFAQSYLGYSATETGILFMPMAFCMVLAAPLGASLTGKVEPRFVIITSTLVAALGVYLFTGLDVKSGPTDIVVPLMIMSFGMGFGMAQRTNIIASAVPTEEIGIASSILALARNIAGAFGIAIFATIINYATEENVMSIARDTVINEKTAVNIAEATSLITIKATINAYHLDFEIAALVLLVGAVLAWFLKVNEVKDAKVHIE